MADTPNVTSLNACCFLSSMALWYDTKDFVFGGALLNRGTGGAAYDYTLTGTPTVANDASGRQYIGFDGVDDYLNSPDGTAWTFTTSDSVTLIMFAKLNTIPGTSGQLWGNRSATGGTGPGIHLSVGSAANCSFRVGDGTNGAAAPTLTAPTTQISTFVGWRDRTAVPIVNYALNGVESTATADPTTLTVDNAFASRVARLSSSGTAYIDMNVYAFGMLRRAPTADDKLLISDIALARFS